MGFFCIDRTWWGTSASSECVLLGGACAELCYFAEMMTGLIEGLLVSTIGGKPKDING